MSTFHGPALQNLLPCRGLRVKKERQHVTDPSWQKYAISRDVQVRVLKRFHWYTSAAEPNQDGETTSSSLTFLQVQRSPTCLAAPLCPLQQGCARQHGPNSGAHRLWLPPRQHPAPVTPRALRCGTGCPCSHTAHWDREPTPGLSDLARYVTL